MMEYQYIKNSKEPYVIIWYPSFASEYLVVDSRDMGDRDIIQLIEENEKTHQYLRIKLNNPTKRILLYLKMVAK